MRHWFAIIIAALVLAVPAVAKEPKMSTDPKVAVVERMIDAWNTRNWPLVAALFTEDGVLHSMMIEPVVGRKAIDARISAMGAGISQITLNIKNIGRVGDVVFVERVDSFTYNGHKGQVPVVGVLEVEGDKIKVWREYYDRAELVAAMGLKEDFHKPTN
jgi:limonene-1,2-epoxide hydrolase